MVVGVTFATGCMTCFGSAVLIGMVVYVGLAGSPLVGAALLFLFSLGMGVPLIIGALAAGKICDPLPVAKILYSFIRCRRIIATEFPRGFFDNFFRNFDA